MSLEFTTVTGRFLRAIVDAEDPDAEPELVPAVGLSVEFHVDLAPSVLVDETVDPPVTILAEWVKATTDADGDLSIDGTKGVTLVSSDNDEISPNGFTYSVVVTGLDDVRTRFSFVAPSGGEVDLATVIPVPANPGAELAPWLGVVALVQAAVVEAATHAAEAAASAEEASAGSDSEWGDDPLPTLIFENGLA